MLDSAELMNLYTTPKNKVHNDMVQFLTEKGYQINHKPGGYIYANPGDNNQHILLTAHMDTINDVNNQTPPTREEIFQKGDWIGQKHKQKVLGGDDRNGVFLIKNLVNEGHRPHVVLTHDEETGGAGAESFLNDFPTQDHIKLGVGIDRGFHGANFDPTKDKLNQVVYYNNDSQDTKDFFTRHGFQNSTGSTSDIKKIGDKYQIPYANVSAAYINEHTSKELTNMNDLNMVYNNLKNIMNENDNLNLTYKKKEYETHYFYPTTTGKNEENDYDYEDYIPANHPANTIKNIDVDSNQEVNDWYNYHQGEHGTDKLIDIWAKEVKDRNIESAYKEYGRTNGWEDEMKWEKKWRKKGLEDEDFDDIKYTI